MNVLSPVKNKDLREYVVGSNLIDRNEVVIIAAHPIEFSNPPHNRSAFECMSGFHPHNVVSVLSRFCR